MVRGKRERGWLTIHLSIASTEGFVATSSSYGVSLLESRGLSLDLGAVQIQAEVATLIPGGFRLSRPDWGHGPGSWGHGPGQPICWLFVGASCQKQGESVMH